MDLQLYGIALGHLEGRLIDVWVFNLGYEELDVLKSTDGGSDAKCRR